MKVKTPNFNFSPFLLVEEIADIKKLFNFKNNFKIIDEDLDEVRFDADLNGRRRKDAEILSLFAANVVPGKMLEIGTYKGHSTTRMAINSPESTIYTVNIHPDELNEGGELVTDGPSIEEIGEFYKKNNLENVTQIFANTKTWSPPNEINDLSLVFIDGCHDKECVYSDTNLVIDRVKPGGFILWHDTSPVFRNNYHWIHESMSGIEKAYNENSMNGYIFNYKYSWIGIWQKK